MKYVFLAVFVLSTAVHLYASIRKDTKLRNITKPFILLSLLGFYVLAARSPAAAIILALLFSWIGDVLLIPKGVKWFTLGGIAFMVSHAFFIAGYCRDIDFSKIDAVLVVVLTLLFASAVAFIFSRLKPHLPKALFYPMFLYLLLNGAMNCFAIFRLISLNSAAALTTAIGAVLFFVSDTSLFFVRFKKESRLKTHFLVMLTYSVGELLIVLGLL
ncbi:MAG: lysoplasmalogenase [Oscillospiraceae bacterium]|nr:lysoplasmalogenase [Oscillospiraceae bacterium]